MIKVPNSTLLAFGKLPPLMKVVIDHEENTEINKSIEKDNKLTEAQGDQMMEIIRKIILKVIAPNELLKTINKDIQLSETQAKQLALDLFGRRFLPMQWYVGNVEGLIKDLGGDVEKYTAEAKQNYPEVYKPEAMQESVAPEITKTSGSTKPADANEPTILHNLEEKLSSNKGRAGVLLHLVNLSQQIEDRVAAKSMTPEMGQELIHSLDSLSYAVNTQDLNPLEIAAIKRKVRSVLMKLGLLTA